MFIFLINDLWEFDVHFRLTSSQSGDRSFLFFVNLLLCHTGIIDD
jgi:hypothetical protein